MGEWRIQHRDSAGAGAQAPHVTYGGKAKGCAGIGSWSMGLPRWWRLQGYNFQQQKAFSYLQTSGW